MEQDENRATNCKEPKVQFRWCGPFLRQTDSVSLFLSSLSGVSNITLHYKPRFGWYESDLVALPLGIHSGSIKLDNTVESSEDIARTQLLKVDPFFVSPHKFAIELFTQDGQSKNLSAPHLINRSDTPLDNRFNRRKCQSCNDLNKKTGKSEEENLSSGKLHLAPSKWTSYYCSSGLGWEEDGSPTRLKKCQSLGDKIDTFRGKHSPDSQYHSRNRSLHADINTVGVAQTSGRNYGSYGNLPSTSPLSKLKKSNTLGSPSFRDKDSLYESINKHSIDIQEIEKLLDQSNDSDEEKDRALEEFSLKKNDLFFEGIDPLDSESYGCVITFESRSTSMNDVGSPRALEEALVSLTSIDSSSKCVAKEESTSYPESSSCNVGVNVELIDELSSSKVSQSSIPDRVKTEQPNVDIHEDQNFEFSSIYIEDTKIPLDIKSVLEEDSFENNFHSSFKDFEDKNQFVLNSVDNSNVSGTSTLKEPVSFNHENSGCEYISTSSSVLVDPGSLKSETDESMTIKSRNNLIPDKSENSREKQSSFSSEKTNISTKSIIKRSSYIKSLSVPPSLPITAMENLKNSSNVNTVGTQTSDKESTPERRSPKHHQFTSTKYSMDSIDYRPLPNRLWSPFSTKEIKYPDTQCPYSPNSRIRSLQKYLYNLDKADQILKSIHPFDYRPTIIHSDTRLKPSDRPLRAERYIRKPNYNRADFIPSHNIQNSSSSEHSTEFKHTFGDSIDRENFSRKISKSSKFTNRVFSAKPSSSYRRRRSENPNLKDLMELSSTDADSEFEVLHRAYSLPNLQNRLYDESYGQRMTSSTGPEVHAPVSVLGTRNARRTSDIGQTIRSSSLYRRRLSLGNAVPYSDEPSDTEGLLDEASRYSTRAAIVKRRAMTKTSLIESQAPQTDVLQPPYLPYNAAELRMGQLVKVLVPGRGVALAKVAYTPGSSRRSSSNEAISVLLLSEPHSYSGRVISVPLKKILLAWPKS